MLERLIRLVAVAASVLVVLGWGLFAVDEARSASRGTAAEIQGRAASRTAQPSHDQERAREAVHHRPGELIDDANDVLLAPFAWLASGSSSAWLRRTLPALVALLAYGFGLAVLARALPRTS